VRYFALSASDKTASLTKARCILVAQGNSPGIPPGCGGRKQYYPDRDGGGRGSIHGRPRQGPVASGRKLTGFASMERDLSGKVFGILKEMIPALNPIAVLATRPIWALFAPGQKVLLAIKSMGGESAEAWRTVLDDATSSSSSMARRGSTRPLPRSGTECRCNAARFTSSEILSRMRSGACMTRSPRTATT
jgi:hypothetical protein